MEPAVSHETDHDTSHDTGQETATRVLPRFAVVDIETSGLSLRRNRILQVAVVTVDLSADAGPIVD